MSQRDQILGYLKRGRTLTPLAAQVRFGCMRLAARIAELRNAGYAIEVTRVPTPNGKHVARYKLHGERA